MRGPVAIAEALRRLLAPAGLVARKAGPAAWRIERADRLAAPPTAPEARRAVVPETVSAPIVVTAAKQPQALADAPFAVAVVDLRTIAATAPAKRGSGWLATNVEGLALTGLGPGRNRMFVRGVADSAFDGPSQSTVAILLDDARLTYSAPDPDVRLVDIERVELLKGPQGSLYGTGALGGIYQIVSRKPDTDNASLGGETAVETVTHGGFGGSASGVLNLPLQRGVSALRIAGYTALEPGWVDSGARNDGNDTRVSGARATLRTTVGADWLVDLTGFAQWLNSRDSQYVYRRGGRTRPAQPPEPHDNDLRNIALRIERSGERTTLRFGSAMTWHEVGDVLNATLGASGFGIADPGTLKDERRYRVWDNEIRLNGALGGSRWLLGATYLEARQTREQDLKALTGPASLVLSDERRLAADAGLFGEIAIPLASKLELTAGARAFSITSDLDRADTASSSSDDRRRTGVTPSAALAWHPAEHRLFFVRYGSAFRQGGLGRDGEPLKGDELATLEADWRETLPRGGRFDLGIYYSRWDHLQSDALGPSGLISTIDAGRGRIEGAEASLDLPLGGGWRLGAGGNLQSALLTRNASGFQLEDRRLPVAPRYTLRGWLRHEWTVGETGLSAQLDLRYLGPSRLSFDPVLDRPAGKVFESRSGLAIRSKNVEIGASIDNILGNAANLFAYGNPLRIAGGDQFIPQRPRSFLLSVRLVPD